MSDGSRVSIVITAHNYARWLPQAIDSALAQTWPEVEVVVVDDGSTDETPEIVARYQAEHGIEAVRLEERGLAAACNAGIRASSGSYIVRLDADDFFDPNLVLVFVSHLERTGDDIVFADHYLTDTDGTPVKVVRHAPLGDAGALRDRPALGAGVMYRRSVFDETGGYDESLRRQEDYDFWLKVFDRYRIANLSLPLMYYRQHGTSMSTNWDARMQARQTVKRTHREKRGIAPAKANAVILVDRFAIAAGDGPFGVTGAADLLEHMVRSLEASEHVETLLVAGGDSDVAARARALGVSHTDAAIHDIGALSNVKICELARNALRAQGVESGLAAVTSVRTPLLTPAQIDEAFDTLEIFDTGTVVALSPDERNLWTYGREGVRPHGTDGDNIDAAENAMFAAVPGFTVFDLDPAKRRHGAAIGHIEVSPETTLFVRTPADLATARVPHAASHAQEHAGAPARPRT